MTLPEFLCATPLVTEVRWMIRRDWADVVRIDAASHPDPWCETEIVNRLRSASCTGFVADYAGFPVGYVVLDGQRGCYEIVRLAVDPDYRRRGVGRQLVAFARTRLNPRRPMLGTTVAESNVGAQLFLRSCGLRCVSIEREAFGSEDGYTFATAGGSPCSKP